MLDSSAWVEYFAGTELGAKAKKIIENEEIMTCILSIAELSDKFSREKEDFGDFLGFVKSSSAIANITVETCSEAGKLKSERRQAKKDFGLADAIIYLTAKENSCILVAKDRDFEGMKNAVLLEEKTTDVKNSGGHE